MNISDTLTEAQKIKAFEWYQEHNKHVDKLINTTKKMYAPTESEDKNNPNLWKAEHWRWFLKF